MTWVGGKMTWVRGWPSGWRIVDWFIKLYTHKKICRPPVGMRAAALCPRWTRGDDGCLGAGCWPRNGEAGVKEIRAMALGGRRPAQFGRCFVFKQTFPGPIQDSEWAPLCGLGDQRWAGFIDTRGALGLDKIREVSSGNVGTAPCQGQLEGKKLCRSLRGQARGDEEKVKASQRLMKKKKNQVWNNI